MDQKHLFELSDENLGGNILKENLHTVKSERSSGEFNATLAEGILRSWG